MQIKQLRTMIEKRLVRIRAWAGRVGGYLQAQYLVCRPVVKDRAYYYFLLMRLDKPIGIFLLLWPTLWALWIAAEGPPDLDVFMVFVCGVLLMRSAGVVLNDIADRHFDGRVRRTRNRPIVSGRVTPMEAFYLATGLILIAFLLVLSMNRLTVSLSLVGLILAALYPFMKRHTYLPQFFLGFTFGWSIIMAFAAQTNAVPRIAWLILVTNVLWTVVYDTIYALIDEEDDARIGVKSTAVLFADSYRIIIAIIQSLVLIAFVLIANQLEFGWRFYSALSLAGGLSVYQLILIRDKDPELCMRAFLSNNLYGAVIFAGIFLHYMMQ